MLQCKNPADVYRIFFNPGEVVEIRALGLCGKGPWEGFAGGTGIVSGYFDNPQDFGNAARALDKAGATGVYFTLNPCKPELIARAANRLKAINGKTPLTTDKDIAAVRWLPIDLDPVRPSGISSTDEELKAAIELRDKIVAWLQERGIAAGVLAVSGNGAHLLIRLMDSDPQETPELIKEVLAVISKAYPTEKTGVSIDQEVFNASRIWRLYGTTARKGDNLAQRPHRQSYIATPIGSLNEVPVNSLNMIKSLIPESRPEQQKRREAKEDNYGNSGRLDLSKYLDHYGVEYNVKCVGEATFYRLAHCVFDSSHTKNEAAIVQNADGVITYQCFHDSCKGRTWHEARRAISGDDSLAPFISTSSEEPRQKRRGKLSQADILVQLAEGENIEFFHTPEQEAYTKLKVADHYEFHAVRSKAFRQWLCRQFYQQTHKAPSSQAVADALSVLEGKASFEGPERPVFVRVAEHNGCIYLDLANDKWQVVKITDSGWKVVNDSPVCFRRPPSLLPLPTPKQNGDITLLRKFLNLASEQDWILTIAWLIQALRPRGPYPVLALYGEQGSAKSTFSRILKKLIDPSSVLLRTAPKNEHDLVISANNAWVLSFDNLSAVQPWLSDAFCRLSTGGGMATRRLYTDSEEVLFDTTRPQIINGITDIVNRHDLADRCISIVLPPIPEERRIPEARLFKQLDAVLPSVLGGLLNAVVVGLKNIGKVELARLPRMADFALWVVAAEPALPWDKGKFLEAYEGNRRDIIEKTVDTDIFASTVLKWFNGRHSWEGTAADLLAELETFVDDEKLIRSRAWPQDAARLGRKLRRIASFLRELGINVIFSRDENSRKIKLKEYENYCHYCTYRHESNDSNNLEHDSNHDSNDSNHDSKGFYCHERAIKNSNKNNMLQNHDSNDSNDGKIHTFSKDKNEQVIEFEL